MLINPSEYNFLEKNIVVLQITIDRVHPVQSSSRSDYCNTTNIKWKHTKNAEKRSLNDRGLAHTIQPETDFSRTCSFCEVLNNADLIT